MYVRFSITRHFFSLRLLPHPNHKIHRTSPVRSDPSLFTRFWTSTTPYFPSADPSDHQYQKTFIGRRDTPKQVFPTDRPALISYSSSIAISRCLRSRAPEPDLRQPTVVPLLTSLSSSYRSFDPPYSDPSPPGRTRDPPLSLGDPRVPPRKTIESAK